MKFLFFQFLFLTLSTYFQLHAQSWQIFEMSPIPEKITNNAVVAGFPAGNPYVYSFGGLDSTKTKKGIHLRSYKYSVASDYWEQIPSLPDTLGKLATAASRVKDTIYIIGGYHVVDKGKTVSSGKVHRFDTKTDTFLTDGADTPQPVDSHVQAVWRDSLIYVISGRSENKLLPIVQIYNPATNTWDTSKEPTASEVYKSFGASGTIIGDTIFYFGGAGSGKSFPAQNALRKGVINVENPSEILWSDTTLDVQIKGFQMAATNVDSRIFWIGGSETSYNFRGITFDGKKKVQPMNRILFYDTANQNWGTSFVSDVPMDLRGVGNLSKNLKILVGGMLNKQQVSNKTFRFEWTDR